MDQLSRIRLEKHREYLRHTWLPEFFQKYRPLFDSQLKAQRVIINAIRKYYLPDVANREFLEYIPGIYRMRVKLDQNNLVKPEDKKTDSPDNSDFESSDDYTKTNNNDDVDIDADINQVMQESLKEYNEYYKNSIKNTINESIINNTNLDYDEYFLNKAISESLEHETYDTFCLVIDIRDFHTNPSQPLMINDVPYYLSSNQIEQLQKLWNKVNPDTSAGMKFQQDLAYQKGLINDKKKLEN
ncbi:hypothetical protein Indivirus_2_87 [Indivirus ILV1]|uniref:Uncharacterized protein n=1 Tax=Indivirus ILV1 TaxID=1977633 RepID=A0A1V0SDI0_9VIRU|nr:hypothetical protein Indivirus_2_87 [Indivirus ILV1]